jgi:Tfp pilus assembly major pilin PilA
MRNKQLGISLGGLMAGAAVLIVLAMIGLKLTPSYLEFFSIKKAVTALAAESRGGASVAEIRKGFDNRATIDAIESVKGSDLEVTKDSGGIVISVAYRKEIPLVANIGVYIEFRAVSKD